MKSKVEISKNDLQKAIDDLKRVFEVKPSKLIKFNWVKLIGQWEWALNNGIEYAIVTERLVKNKKLFNQLLEDVYHGKHKSDTPEQCGFINFRKFT